MAGFTKLSSSLIASSVWNEPDNVRIVWITMLAMADQNGDVKASLVGLAYQARKTVQDTRAALNVLEGPDPDSGRKEMDGRRAIPQEGGWHLVTHDFYREQGMSEEARAYWREKKRQYRLVSKTKKDKGQMSECPVPVSVPVQKSRKRIVKEKPSQLQVEEYAEEIGQPRSDGTAMYLHFEDHGWPKVWRIKIQKWKAWGYLPSQKQKGNGQYNSKPDDGKRYDREGRRVDEYGRRMDANQVRVEDQYLELERKRNEKRLGSANG